MNIFVLKFILTFFDSKSFFYFRLANILQTTTYKEDDVWAAAREVKSETSSTKDCAWVYHYHNFQDSDIYNNYVTKIEQKLNITTSETLLEDMTRENLEIAADIFIYLWACSTPLKHWFIFYTDLLQTQSPDQIVLKLNRILKGGNSPENKILKTIASDLFKRITTLFSLKYTEMDTKSENMESLSVQTSDHLKGIRFLINNLLLYPSNISFW